MLIRQSTYLYTFIVYWKTKKRRSKYLALGPGPQKPFGYRVAHHGYLLTSCPGPFDCFIPKHQKLSIYLFNTLKSFWTNLKQLVLLKFNLKFNSTKVDLKALSFFSLLYKIINVYFKIFK